MVTSNGYKEIYNENRSYKEIYDQEYVQATARRREERRTAAKERQREFNMVAKSIWTIFLAVALLIGTVGIRTATVLAHDRLNAAQSSIMKIQNDIDRVTLELSQAKSLDRIDALARERLGMVQPDAKSLSVVVVSSIPASNSAVVKSNTTASRSQSSLPSVLAFLQPLLRSVTEAISSSVAAGLLSNVSDSIPSVLN